MLQLPALTWRILLVDADGARAGGLTALLGSAGFHRVRRTTGGISLAEDVAEAAPEVIVADMGSPDRDTLEGLPHNPERPIVPVVGDPQSVAAGVSFYRVGHVDAPTIEPIQAAAIAAFRSHPQALQVRGGAMRIGLPRLADAAPVIMARELGLFAAEGLDVELSIEPSWANIADKLALGFLDAAVVVPPLAFALALGLRGPPCPIFVPQSLSLGGNSVTLSTSLVRHVALHLGAGTWTSLVKARALAVALKESGEKPVLAVVHRNSTHNLLLRYWLAAGGIDPDKDVRLAVVPPELLIEALRSGRIAGFCAGAPWGAVAKEMQIGAAITSSQGIWRNGPDKALAVSESWAQSRPADLLAAQRALLQAAIYCDAPEHAGHIAETLSGGDYLGVRPEVVARSLPSDSAGSDPRQRSSFFRHAASVPWHSHALWFLQQMARWDLIPAASDFQQIAERIYRPDFYAAAARSLNLPVPQKTFKREGHSTAWRCPADPAPMDMEPDGFCDGVPFTPVEA